MKPKLLSLLFAAALLPAALLAQNVDVGLFWVTVPPETVDPGSNHELCVWLKNYTAPAVVDQISYMALMDSFGCFYSDTNLFSLLGGDSMLGEPFPVRPPRGFSAKFGIIVSGDTNPANDTLWWRPVIRSGLSERRSSSAPQPELRPLPTHFCRSITITCREPTPVVIYDACGNVVRTLAPAREVVWDGRDRFGHELPAGVYSICCGPGQSARVVKTR